MEKSVLVSKNLYIATIAATFFAVGMSNSIAQETEVTGSAKIALGGYYDFDKAKTSKRGGADIRYILSADGKEQLIEPLNRAGLGVLEGNRDLYKTCAAKIDDLAASRVNISLATGPVYVCVRTSRNRPGVLMIDPKNLRSQEKITIGFTVWKRPRTKPAPSTENKIIPKIAKRPPTESESDPLFEPPIDPVVKPDEREPKGDQEDATTLPDPVVKPDNREPKGSEDDTPTIVIGPVDKPGSPGPKGSDNDTPVTMPADPEDDDIASGPTFPPMRAELNTREVSCPSRDTVKADLLSQSLGDLKWRGSVDNWKPVLFFVDAWIDASRKQVMCRYNVTTQYLNYKDGFTYHRPAFDFNFQISSPGACENVSGFVDNDGGGLVCSGNLARLDGYPISQGSEPEACIARCPVPASLD
jgi:hypothetical protein